MSELENQDKLKAKAKRNNIIVIVLSVILVAVAALYFMQSREHTSILNELHTEKDSIQVELNNLMVVYDSLETENDTINEQLMYAQTKVKDLLLEVEQTKKISYQKISDYQNQVSTLRGIMRDFVVQIDSLNRRNEQLMAENFEVKEQYKQVEAEKQQLSQDKQQLERQVQQASRLGVRDLVAEPLNVRSKETRYARRAEKVRIYFVLTENVTAKRGPKNVYARIMRPDQLLLLKSDDNVFQFEDLKIPYSAMREVVYEGQDLPVAIFWDNSDEPQLMEGEYTVDLFADGNNIGTTTFSLR
ncbi:MAG: coiled-coil domain-containing protein [Prolixibacteraceae bacterium]